MAMAGFYAIHNSEIRLAGDGKWYADGEPIRNKRISRLFSRSIRRSDRGGFELQVGDERAEIIVEDTPYFVTSVDIGESNIEIVLNDETRETLDIGSLEISEQNVSYCRVKNGSERARFLRAAHYILAELVRESADGGFEIRFGSHVYPLRH